MIGSLVVVQELGQLGQPRVHRLFAAAFLAVHVGVVYTLIRIREIEPEFDSFIS